MTPQATQSQETTPSTQEEESITMTQRFVRYSAEVERADPTFEQGLQTAVDDVKRYVAQSVAAPGATRAIRDAHAKGYGLARGEVEILGGLPTAYAQGIYATPGRHEAMVRF
jgi:hypothetical protein